MKNKPRISIFRRIVGVAILIMVLGFLYSLSSGRFRNYAVTSESMEPTVLIGDYLLVDARPPIVPRVGDIVAIINPQNPTERLCKRVVAQPFDTVAFVDGVFYLNGEAQTEFPYETLPPRKDIRSITPLRLGAEEYYVLGDNREFSYDSKVFGPVRPVHLIGIIRYVYWPPARARALPNPYSAP